MRKNEDEKNKLFIPKRYNCDFYIIWNFNLGKSKYIYINNKRNFQYLFV